MTIYNCFLWGQQPTTRHSVDAAGVDVDGGPLCPACIYCHEHVDMTPGSIAFVVISGEGIRRVEAIAVHLAHSGIAYDCRAATHEDAAAVHEAASKPPLTLSECHSAHVTVKRELICALCDDTFEDEGQEVVWVPSLGRRGHVCANCWVGI